jgi:hypothetical protein
MSSFMKIRRVAGKLLYAGRRTDRHDEAIFAFRNFANAPKT